MRLHCCMAARSSTVAGRMHTMLFVCFLFSFLLMVVWFHSGKMEAKSVMKTVILPKK